MALRSLKEFYYLNNVRVFQASQREVAFVDPCFESTGTAMGIVPDKFNRQRATILIEGGIDISPAATADPVQEVVSVASRINEKIIHTRSPINPEIVTKLAAKPKRLSLKLSERQPLFYLGESVKLQHGRT